MANSVSDWLNSLHPTLRPLWDFENELRKAAQNAIFLRKDEAKKHLDEARRHYAEARVALRGERSHTHNMAADVANSEKEPAAFPSPSETPRRPS
jgi:hypothetical protein